MQSTFATKQSPAVLNCLSSDCITFVTATYMNASYHDKVHTVLDSYLGLSGLSALTPADSTDHAFYTPAPQPATESRIPKIVFQTWKDRQLGPETRRAVGSWQQLNPEYDHYLFDDQDIVRYVQHWLSRDGSGAVPVVRDPTIGGLRNNFMNAEYYRAPFLRCDVTHVWWSGTTMEAHSGTGNEYAASGADEGAGKFTLEEIALVQQAFARLTVGASRIDLWRYMVLYEFGGVYADIDSICLNPLLHWVSPDAQMVTGIGGRGDMSQWVMIYAPRHPILAQVIRSMSRKIHENDDTYIRSRVEYIGGPRALTTAGKHVFCTQPHVTETLQLLPCDHYCDNILVKDVAVQEELQVSGNIHWTKAVDRSFWYEVRDWFDL